MSALLGVLEVDHSVADKGCDRVQGCRPVFRRDVVESGYKSSGLDGRALEAICQRVAYRGARGGEMHRAWHRHIVALGDSQ